MQDPLSQKFKALMDEWGDAIANKRYDWFERHFSEDFHGTAQPWPTLSVNKQQMIDLDKAIDTMEVTWVDVQARQIGDTVLTVGLVKYDKEEFKPGAVIAEGMPTGEELSAYTNGKTAMYVNGWRKSGDVWQIFDHHLVGLVDYAGADA